MKNKHLHNIKGTGFNVPDNYFEEFEKSIFSQANLKDLVVDSGLKEPEGYFDNLEEQILSKVSTKKETKVIGLFTKKTLFYASSVAAAIVLLFSLTFKNLNTISFDSLDIETVNNYILNEAETDELAALFIDTELNETNFINYNLNDDTIDSYLESLDDIELISE